MTIRYKKILKIKKKKIKLKNFKQISKTGYKQFE